MPYVATFLFFFSFFFRVFFSSITMFLSLSLSLEAKRGRNENEFSFAIVVTFVGTTFPPMYTCEFDAFAIFDLEKERNASIRLAFY